MNGRALKVQKKDLDRYSEYETYQFMRTERSQFGDIILIRHPRINECVYMKEVCFTNKRLFENEILRWGSISIL